LVPGWVVNVGESGFPETSGSSEFEVFDRDPWKRRQE
jgi:hypothetical protein